MKGIYQTAWLFVMLASVYQGKEEPPKPSRSSLTEGGSSYNKIVEENCDEVSSYINSKNEEIRSKVSEPIKKDLKEICSKVFDRIQKDLEEIPSDLNDKTTQERFRNSLMSQGIHDPISCADKKFFIKTQIHTDGGLHAELNMKKRAEAEKLTEILLTPKLCVKGKSINYQNKAILVALLIFEHKEGLDKVSVLKNFKQQAQDFTKKINFMVNFVDIFVQLGKRGLLSNNVLLDTAVVDKNDIEKVAIRKFQFSLPSNHADNGRNINDYSLAENFKQVAADKTVNYVEYPAVARFLILLQDYCTTKESIVVSNLSLPQGVYAPLNLYQESQDEKTKIFTSWCVENAHQFSDTVPKSSSKSSRTSLSESGKQILRQTASSNSKSITPSSVPFTRDSNLATALCRFVQGSNDAKGFSKFAATLKYIQQNPDKVAELPDKKKR